MSAQFPNVPITPGVPPVARSSAFPFDSGTEPALTRSGPGASAAASSQWGLYMQDGSLAVVVDNVVALELGLEARISSYPVEKGGFGSYNKVIVPGDIRLIMSRGGPISNRQDFIKAVQDGYFATTLYNVVTPEAVYLDMNVVGVRRVAAADHGAGLVTLEVALQHVRQTAKLAYTSTREPSGNGQVRDGSVQTTERADSATVASGVR